MYKYATFKKDIFYDRKMFDGESYKLSLSNPMGLVNCTKERAEYIADKLRNEDWLARIVKKRWTDFEGNSRVAYVVYQKRK